MLYLLKISSGHFVPGNEMCTSSNLRNRGRELREKNTNIRDDNFPPEATLIYPVTFLCKYFLVILHDSHGEDPKLILVIINHSTI
jgi:hypothetical protein